MQIDKDKIKKRFAEIREALEETEKIISFSNKEFFSSKEHLAAV